MSEITVELDDPIMYSSKEKGAGEVEGSFVTLSSPTGKVSHICCEIESITQSAIAKSAAMLPPETIAAARDKQEEEEEKEDDEEMDAQTLLTMINAGGADMRKMALLFRELFKEVGQIGGEKQFTMPIMDRLSHRDLRKMMGEYLVNFVYL